MTVHLSPAMEALVQKRIESGAYSTPEEDDWMSENREEVSAMIEEGWAEAERGELIDGDTARAEMRKYKEEWL